MSCASCHDNHGSAAPKLLGVYQAASDINTIGALTITANNNTVCYGCHTAASTGFPYAASSRTASGYPNHGTWPGEATYTVAYVQSAHTGSAHATAAAVSPGLGYAGGDCKNCHDPHGTSNPYAMSSFGSPRPGRRDRPAAFDLCFKCHGDSRASGATDIKQFVTAADPGRGPQVRPSRHDRTSLRRRRRAPVLRLPHPHGSKNFDYRPQDLTTSVAPRSPGGRHGPRRST